MCVSAQGSGDGARFAAIFVDSEQPVARTFRSHGPSPAVAKIDNAMQNFLRDHEIRGAALAITQGTQLVYARGYTVAEPNYPDVQPTTLFRLASCSKTICALEIYQLLQDTKKLPKGLDTTMQSILNLKAPDGGDPKDSRFSAITIRHLLDMNSALPRGAILDSAAAKFGKPLPATAAELASYIAALQMEDTKQPGDPSNVAYNNTGYFLLGRVVAALRGVDTFESAISPLLRSLAIRRIRGARSLLSSQAADEAHYHLSNLVRTSNYDDLGSLAIGPSVRDASPLVPWQYGVWDYEMFEGAGGLSAAVTAARDAMLHNSVLSTSTLTGPEAHGFHGFDLAWVADAEHHVYSACKGGWIPSNQSVPRSQTGGGGKELGRHRPIPPVWHAGVLSRETDQGGLAARPAAVWRSHESPAPGDDRRHESAEHPPDRKLNSMPGEARNAQGRSPGWRRGLLVAHAPVRRGLVAHAPIEDFRIEVSVGSA